MINNYPVRIAYVADHIDHFLLEKFTGFSAHQIHLSAYGTLHELLDDTIRNGDSKKPDLILTEVFLADGTVFELLNALENITRDSPIIPICLLTHSADKQLISKAMKSQLIKGCLLKPLSLRLMSNLDSLIQTHIRPPHALASGKNPEELH